MLWSRVSFRLSVRRVVSTVILVGSALFLFLTTPYLGAPLGVRYERRNQLQNVLFAFDIGKGL